MSDYDGQSAGATVELDSGSSELRIDGYSIQDGEVAEYFREREDQEFEPLVDAALRVGVLALGVADTSRQVDYVRRHFEQLQSAFKTDLDDHLGDDGRLERKLDLKFEELLRELAVDAAEERGRQEVEQQTRIKGLEFEEAIEAQLSEIAADTGDVVEATGTIDGHTGGKVGDFVFNLTDCQRSIVIEAKNKGSIQQPEIQREMEEALENRAADYGIFVARARNQMATKVGTFTEFGRDYLTVGLSKTESDPVEPELLRVALKWGRMRVIENHLRESESLDPAKIREHVAEAERCLEQFKQIRSQCTNIEKSVDTIREKLGAIEEDLDEHLDTIASQVNQ